MQSLALAQTGSLIALLLLGTAGNAAQEAESESEFLRFVDKGGDAALETSIVRMRHPNGTTVDLIGAVHVGDTTYYAELNERFRAYDALLFEMVGEPAPKGATLRKSTNGGELAWVGVLQERLRDALQLSAQMEQIDYHASNMVHADMTLDEFVSTQKASKESFASLWLRAMQAQQRQPLGVKIRSEADGMQVLMQLLFQAPEPNQLKRVLGRQFNKVEKLMLDMEGDDPSVLIGKRNARAIEVMQQQMATGKRSMGIFYGAAHLPDMAERLEVLGFRRAGEPVWLRAWHITESMPQKRRVKRPMHRRIADEEMQPSTVE